MAKTTKTVKINFIHFSSYDGNNSLDWTRTLSYKDHYPEKIIDSLIKNHPNYRISTYSKNLKLTPSLKKELVG